MTKIYFPIFFFFFFQFNQVIGQIRVDLDEEVKKLYYDRFGRVTKFKEMKDFRDVFHYNKLLLGQNRFSGNIFYVTGRVAIEDTERVVHNEVRSCIAFSTRIRFYEEFCINSTFYLDFNKKAVAPWLSDFTYSIGRYNWRANRFSYGYENYLNNRYSDDYKTLADKFMKGYYFIAFNQSPKKFSQKIRIDSTTSLRFIYFIRYSIMYSDKYYATQGGIFSGKPTLGAALRYTMFWNIYLESAVYFYPNTAQQQSWDPDYTYGFGYFDWRSFRISVTYGNWAINRFSGNDAFPHYGFMDGQFRIIGNWIW